MRRAGSVTVVPKKKDYPQIAQITQINEESQRRTCLLFVFTLSCILFINLCNLRNLRIVLLL